MLRLLSGSGRGGDALEPPKRVGLASGPTRQQRAGRIA
jgi:hypothetical protein